MDAALGTTRQRSWISRWTSTAGVPGAAAGDPVPEGWVATPATARWGDFITGCLPSIAGDAVVMPDSIWSCLFAFFVHMCELASPDPVSWCVERGDGVTVRRA